MKERLIAALALAAGLSLAAAGPSSAQADNEHLGRQIAHELFTAVNVSQAIRNGAAGAGGMATFDKYRPEWRPLMLDAIDETVTQDQPQLEAMLGHALAVSMTPEEMEAGLTVLHDPQARAALAASTRHEPPPPGAQCSQTCLRAMASPAGRGFASKMRTAFGPELQHEMIVALIPDMFIRFGEKAKAWEAQHPAAQVVK